MNKFLLTFLLVGVICVQQIECQIGGDGPPLNGGDGGFLPGGLSPIDASDAGFKEAMKALKKQTKKTDSITDYQKIIRQLRKNDKLTKKNKADRSDITNVIIEEQVVAGMKYYVSFTCKKNIAGVCQADQPDCKFSFVYQSWMTPSIQANDISCT